MAGHSQFKNIMHRKGRQDAIRPSCSASSRAKSPSRPRWACPIPAMNPRLRAAILAARAESMPKDNIERAIKKATGSEAENYDEIRYEGYGPGGVAVIVEVLTDNRNRSAGEVRASFTKSRRQSRRNRRGVVHVRSCRRRRVRRQGGERRRHARGGDRGGRRGRGVRRERSRDLHHAATLRDVAKALEAKFGEPRKAALVWKPQNTVRGRRRAGREGA